MLKRHKVVYQTKYEVTLGPGRANDELRFFSIGRNSLSCSEAASPSFLTPSFSLPLSQEMCSDLAPRGAFGLGLDNPLRKGSIYIVKNGPFNSFVLAIILANCITLAMSSNEPGWDATTTGIAIHIMNDYIFTGGAWVLPMIEPSLPPIGAGRDGKLTNAKVSDEDLRLPPGEVREPSPRAHFPLCNSEGKGALTHRSPLHSPRPAQACSCSRCSPRFSRWASSTRRTLTYATGGTSSTSSSSPSACWPGSPASLPVREKGVGAGV